MLISRKVIYIESQPIWSRYVIVTDRQPDRHTDNLPWQYRIMLGFVLWKSANTYAPTLRLFRVFPWLGPMKSGLSSARWLMSNCRNSLRGPPSSTAPSDVPASSVNLTDIWFNGEKLCLEKPLFAPSHRCPRLILNLEMFESSVSTLRNLISTDDTVSSQCGAVDLHNKQTSRQLCNSYGNTYASDIR